MLIDDGGLETEGGCQFRILNYPSERPRIIGSRRSLASFSREFRAGHSSVKRRGGPLCAAQGQRVWAAVRASREPERNKTNGFFPQVRCRVIPRQEIERAGFLPPIFANMNAFDDCEAA